MRDPLRRAWARARAWHTNRLFGPPPPRPPAPPASNASRSAAQTPAQTPAGTICRLTYTNSRIGARTARGWTLHLGEPQTGWVITVDGAAELAAGAIPLGPTVPYNEHDPEPATENQMTHWSINNTPVQIDIDCILGAADGLRELHISDPHTSIHATRRTTA